MQMATAANWMRALAVVVVSVCVLRSAPFEALGRAAVDAIRPASPPGGLSSLAWLTSSPWDSCREVVGLKMDLLSVESLESHRLERHMADTYTDEDKAHRAASDGRGETTMDMERIHSEHEARRTTLRGDMHRLGHDPVFDALIARLDVAIAAHCERL
jgi:hypothetical protein